MISGQFSPKCLPKILAGSYSFVSRDSACRVWLPQLGIASTPCCTKASSWSCTSKGTNCSYSPAITLNSWSESLSAFVQQSPAKLKRRACAEPSDAIIFIRSNLLACPIQAGGPVEADGEPVELDGVDIAPWVPRPSIQFCALAVAGRATAAHSARMSKHISSRPQDQDTGRQEQPAHPEQPTQLCRVDPSCQLDRHLRRH